MVRPFDKLPVLNSAAILVSPERQAAPARLAGLEPRPRPSADGRWGLSRLPVGVFRSIGQLEAEMIVP